jgi:hypothetical protein
MRCSTFASCARVSLAPGSAEALAAAAGARGVGIRDLESRLGQAVGVVEARTGKQLCRGRIDDDLDVPELLDFVRLDLDRAESLS